MTHVNSPLTGKPAILDKVLDKNIIARKYRSELNLDVNKFLKGTTVEIYKCSDTGYRFYYPFDIFGDDNFYAALQKQKSYYTEWKWENEQSFAHLKKTDNILDIGCGDGSFLKGLKKRGFSRLNGLDSSAGSLSYNNIEGISIANTSVEKFSSEHSSEFDVVTCFQVLEHITDVKQFILSCLRCLKKNGKLIIAVPNNNPYLYRHDVYHTLNLPPHHAGLWNKRSLKSICSVFNLRLINLRFQPIGDSLQFYTYVQAGRFSERLPFMKRFFSSRFFRAIQTRILSTFKHRINGHTILAVYEKK